MPPRGIAQDGAHKSGNSRSKAARELAQLSWCQMVPLAVQQKGSKIFGTKKVFYEKSSKVLLPRFLNQTILGQNKFWCLGFRSSCQCPRWFRDHSWAVAALEFRDRPDLGGALHPEISKLTTLYRLDLRGTNVSGSLDLLANNTELQELDLDDTNVSGSLDVLANNTELHGLQLRHTRVTGRLEDLPLKAKGLVDLDLTGTEVAGDLAALANATKLRRLRLSNTAVSGELKSLAKLERLTELDLAETAVFGDAAVMAKWSKIEHVDLSGTQVEFVKTDFFQQFELVKGSYWSLEWQCPLPPALRFLDVSRTSRFRLSEDLLRPLAGCGKLATLKAAGCGLNGPLWPKILHSNGFVISIDRLPLSQALSVLDFARNNVTDVVLLPGSCRTLVLTGNPHVSFGPGVLEKAIQDIVFIDLRNATFANPSDALLLIGQLAVITQCAP